MKYIIHKLIKRNRGIYTMENLFGNDWNLDSSGREIRR